MTKSQKRSPIRRRPTPTQGRGLEILGHAIEYLLDMYVLFPPANGSKDDMDAAQILMKANMAIFEECEEIIPVRYKLWRWLLGFIGVREEIGVLPNKKEALE